MSWLDEQEEKNGERMKICNQRNQFNRRKEKEVHLKLKPYRAWTIASIKQWCKFLRSAVFCVENSLCFSSISLFVWLQNLLNWNFCETFFTFNNQRQRKKKNICFCGVVSDLLCFLLLITYQKYYRWASKNTWLFF